MSFLCFYGVYFKDCKGLFRFPAAGFEIIKIILNV